MMTRSHPFVKTLAASLRGPCRVPPASSILVAVSGGPDSVALLRALAILAPTRPWQLSLAVGHVQHHLRPDSQAESDARFVADLSRSLNLPFFRADLDPAEIQASGNIEAAARRARYRALLHLAHAARAQFLATAHQADDQLETLLMRLLRGSSVHGLRGIARRRRLAADPPLILIRPMLDLDRAAALAFLDHLHQPYCQDLTNADTTRLRARLRHEILPLLRSIRPDVARRAVHLCAHFRQLAALLDQAVAAAADRVRYDQGRTILDRVEARCLSPLVLSALLRRLLLSAGVPADRLGAQPLRQVLRAVRDRSGTVRRFTFHPSVQLLVTPQTVEIHPPAR